MRCLYEFVAINYFTFSENDVLELSVKVKVLSRMKVDLIDVLIELFSYTDIHVKDVAEIANLKSTHTSKFFHFILRDQSRVQSHQIMS